MPENENMTSTGDRESRLWELTSKYTNGQIKEGDPEYEELRKIEEENGEALRKSMMAMSKREVNRKIKRALTYPFRKIYHLIKK